MEGGASRQERKVEADVARLNRLLGQWREPGLQAVRCQDIVPDATNRENMGLSLEHTHFIAASIARDGFKPRRGFEGHDVPVLVRASVAESELGVLSLCKWRQRVMETPGLVAESSTYWNPCHVSEEEFFTSLGNGHFSQALNLIRCKMRNLLTGQRLQVGDDVALSRAIDDGVQSIVLRMDTPRAERKDVSLLLNRLHHIRWDLGDDGELHLAVSSDIPPAEQDPSSQFEALSKVLDAEELSVLVRAKMGIDVSETRDGYASRLRSKL